MLILVLAPVGPARADEVLFLNGDRLTGKILKATSGKLTIKTEGAGEVVVDMSKVKTFSTDTPVELAVKEKPPVSADVGAGPDRYVQTAPTPGQPPEAVAIAEISAINPTPPAWTGSLSLNGLLTTGNSETEQLGFRGALSKRWPDDRLTFGAEYSFGRQEDPSTGEKSTTIDYAMALAKYDHFLTKKFYGYLATKLERDGVAELELRLAPGGGVGYQWFEGPAFNLSSELGLVWVYEDYERTGSREFFGPRLAYSVDWTPIHQLMLFHKLEYLPSFEDLGGDYLLNIDAGARLTVWKGLFAELRYEFRYDSTPASGRHRTDQRYILGAGWAF
jgi:putative salt-induced outer membrane protein YdiY